MTSQLLTAVLVLLASTAAAQTPILGTEHLTWTQAANNLSTANGYGYRVSVDGAATVALTGVVCAGASSPFACSSSLPTLTAGIHDLRILARRTIGQTNLDSALSAPLSVEMVQAPATPGSLGIATVVIPNGCSRTAADVSAAAVQAVINAAASGEVVCVPAGASTWNAGVTISGKDITLQGAGLASTLITLNANGLNVFNITTTASRITGFGLTVPSGDNNFIFTQGTSVRIDHNRFNSSDAVLRLAVYALGNSANGIGHPGALIDHNEFLNARVLIRGDAGDSPEGTSVWAQTSTIGGVDQSRVVYIEDNIMTAMDTGASFPAVDANFGGRYVFRFNTVHNMYTEAHASASRGARSMEVYRNTFEQTTQSTMGFLRAGSFVYFDNVSAGGGINSVVVDNERSFTGYGPPAGNCTGASSWDGNLVNGWPCRDQIGRGLDGAGVFPQAQASEPVYAWNNTVAGIDTAPLVANCGNTIKANGSCADIVSNRDYYTRTATFTGTVGVGVGVFASRPSTCTTGVAYWATDQGSWNAAGADGVLYRCVSTNTWGNAYTPYAYPHPLSI